MSVADRIREKISTALTPLSFELTDESHLHAGHVGARPEGETHFKLKIVSPQFDGKSRIDRQRMVYRVLAEEMAGPVHALALTTIAAAENES